MIVLPSGSCETSDLKSYVAKYTFDGWLIDGNMSIEAIFIEINWSRVDIVCDDAFVKLEFDGTSLLPSENVSALCERLVNLTEYNTPIYKLRNIG